MSHHEARMRRQAKATPSWETLEGRQLLTGGAGNVFAIVPGDVTEVDGQAELRTTIDPANFTIPNGRMVLGIDVAPGGESSAKPVVSEVVGDGNLQVRGMLRSFYSPFIQNDRVVANAPTSAVLVQLGSNPRAEATSTEITTRVKSQEQTTGGILAGYYLPGDANGDGEVDLTDREIVRSSLGSVAGQSTYEFDADANRDGRINPLDLNIVMVNQGVKTNVRPIATANLHEVSDSGPHDRRTIYRDVTFTGEATPGATVTFSEVDGKADDVTTTAGADGHYSARVTLAPGENTFELRVQDGFGQDIRGKIAPVTYLPPMVPVESPLPPEPAGETDPDPAPPTSEDPAEARFQQLKERFPNAMKRLSPDQAENLRRMLAKASASRGS